MLDPGRTERPRRRPLFDSVCATCADGAELSVRVCNLAPGGLRGASALHLTVGELLILQLGALGRVEARVIWARGFDFGAAFERPIDAGALLA